MLAAMFSPGGPTVRELAVQALSSVERGYDLLAPKFDATPFRTPERVLDATAAALRPLGPYARGLDLCCGTGAGVGVLQRLCSEGVVGLDRSAGMLAAGRASAAGPVEWVRADALALPFGAAFQLVVSFGAFGHFLPSQRPALFRRVSEVLCDGGRFAFPVAAPPRPGSAAYWATLGFDTAMRLRNALHRPRFVMYYRTFPLRDVLADLHAAALEPRLHPLPGLGRRPDGTPRAALVVATRTPRAARGVGPSRHGAEHGPGAGGPLRPAC